MTEPADRPSQPAPAGERTTAAAPAAATASADSSPAPDDYAGSDTAGTEKQAPEADPEPAPAPEPNSAPGGPEQGGFTSLDAEPGGPDGSPTPAPLAPLPPDDNGPGDATVRIMCPRDQRCLWAGFELPDPSQHPDPAAEVRQAAGCLDDPQTCVCTAEAQDATRETLEAVAVTAEQVTAPTVVGVMRNRLTSDGPAAGAPVVADGLTTPTPTVLASVTPQQLTTAQAHGLDRAERPMREAIALGAFEVSEVLGRLGLDVPAALRPEDAEGVPTGESSPDGARRRLTATSATGAPRRGGS